MDRMDKGKSDQANKTPAELLEAVRAQLGMVPNILKDMAPSPTVLKSYLGLNESLAEGVLNPKLREKIALTIAQAHNNEYCLAIHAALGKSVGLSADEIQDARRGSSPDPRTNAALRFVRSLLEASGPIPKAGVHQLEKAGFVQAEIGEILAHVSLNLFTNFYTEAMKPPLDFPKADPLPEEG